MAGWVLEDVRIRNFNMPDESYFQEVDHLVWQSFLSGSQLELLLSPPANLALSDLWQYVSGLKQRQQDVAEFEMVFLAPPGSAVDLPYHGSGGDWRRLPFFRSRSRAVSVRLVGALVLGLGFQMLTELATYLGLVMKWSVIPVALVPPILLALFAGWFAGARTLISEKKRPAQWPAFSARLQPWRWNPGVAPAIAGDLFAREDGAFEPVGAQNRPGPADSSNRPGLPRSGSIFPDRLSS